MSEEITQATFPQIMRLCDYRANKQQTIEAMMFSRQDDGQFDLFKMCHYVVQNLKKVDAFYRT